MNFLQIAQKVDELSLIQGTIDSVNPSGGFQQSIIGAVQRANHDINMSRRDWLFNYDTVSISLSTSVNEYTPTGVRRWETVVYDNQELKEYDYMEYLNKDWTSSSSEPYKYTQHPSKKLIFNDLDGNYTVTGHVYLNPDELTDSTDIPRIPEEYHYLIVYKAIEVLGKSIALGTLTSEYMNSYDVMWGQMCRDYIPRRNIQRRPIV